MMRNLRAEVDAGRMRPYCFVEINGLKLASPENIYKVKVHTYCLKLTFLSQYFGYIVCLNRKACRLFMKQ